MRCNRRFEEIFGYEPGELLNRTTRFMFASDAELRQAGGDGVRDRLGGRNRSTWSASRCARTARRIWCSISGRAVQPGDPSQGSVWLLDDITQEHDAEERVQRALAEQELILDNATVGIAFLRNRVIQRCNRFLEEMVGAGPGELVGQSTAVLFASEEDWKRAGKRATQARRPGGTYRGRGARSSAATASTFICRARGRRIDAGDAEQEWIWSYDDVTAEREADARVRRALRRARARGGRAHHRAAGGEGARAAPRRPRRAHRPAQPAAAGGPPDAGAGDVAAATASRPR